MADRQHLGMGRRILQLLDPIAEAGQDRPAGAVHQHGADRHLAARAGGRGLGQGQIHQAGFFRHRY